MTVEIHETTITRDADATIVRLHVADAPPQPSGESSASLRIEIQVRLPCYRTPLVAQVQWEAVHDAQEALTAIADALLQDLPPGARARPTPRS